MTDIRPIIVLPDKVDELLILATFFEGLIGRYGLAFNIFDKFPDEILLVPLLIALDIRDICGDVGGQIYFFPCLVGPVQI